MRRQVRTVQRIQAKELLFLIWFDFYTILLLETDLFSLLQDTNVTSYFLVLNYSASRFAKHPGGWFCLKPFFVLIPFLPIGATSIVSCHHFKNSPFMLPPPRSLEHQKLFPLCICAVLQHWLPARQKQSVMNVSRINMQSVHIWRSWVKSYL